MSIPILSAILAVFLGIVVLYVGYHAAKVDGYRQFALIFIALMISVLGTFLLTRGHAQVECEKVGWQYGDITIDGIVCINSDRRPLDDIKAAVPK